MFALPGWLDSGVQPGYLAFALFFALLILGAVVLVTVANAEKELQELAQGANGRQRDARGQGLNGNADDAGGRARRRRMPPRLRRNGDGAADEQHWHRDAMQELNEAREAHSKGMSLYEMRRRRRDEERAAQDAQNEDEMAKKERQEQQKAARWAAKIRTQEAGEGVPAGGQSPTTLDKFLHCIREGKVVRLEDLAARFQISVEQTIAWIRDLEGAGRLTGVMDDRGKYVYVSPAECKAVAKFIMDKGRVTMEDIAKQTTAAVGLGPP